MDQFQARSLPHRIDRLLLHGAGPCSAAAGMGRGLGSWTRRRPGTGMGQATALTTFASVQRLQWLLTSHRAARPYGRFAKLGRCHHGRLGHGHGWVLFAARWAFGFRDQFDREPAGELSAEGLQRHCVRNVHLFRQGMDTPATAVLAISRPALRRRPQAVIWRSIVAVWAFALLARR
jgi:hypothetical protein